jgi:hypothetical protein
MPAAPAEMDKFKAIRRDHAHHTGENRLTRLDELARGLYLLSPHDHAGKESLNVEAPPPPQSRQQEAKGPP